MSGDGTGGRGRGGDDTGRGGSLRLNPGVAIGGAVVLLFVLVALFAPLIAPHDPYAQNLLMRLKPPFWQEGWHHAHLLGTDQLGRDYLSRLIHGTRVSLLVGFGAVAISAVVGISLGIVAGYAGGWADTAISAVVTTRLSLPVVLVALAVVAIVGGSLQVVVLVIGLLLWDQFAVVARTATQQLRGAEFVGAARAMGAGHLHVLLREILPNIAPPLIVVATVEIANAVLICVFHAHVAIDSMNMWPPVPR